MTADIKTVLTDAEKVRIAAECGVFCTMPQAVAFYDAVLASAGEQAKDSDLLEFIDLKAEAGLCQMTHAGTREFLKDIRAAIASGKSGEVK